MQPNNEEIDEECTYYVQEELCYKDPICHAVLCGAFQLFTLEYTFFTAHNSISGSFLALLSLPLKEKQNNAQCRQASQH